MSYPNSISARRAPRPSGSPGEPLPRRPIGPQPRRSPGRPAPDRPRRPSPGRYPAPRVAPPPRGPRSGGGFVVARPAFAIGRGILPVLFRAVPYIGWGLLGYEIGMSLFRPGSDPQLSPEPMGMIWAPPDGPWVQTGIGDEDFRTGSTARYEPRYIQRTSSGYVSTTPPFPHELHRAGYGGSGGPDPWADDPKTTMSFLNASEATRVSAWWAIFRAQYNLFEGVPDPETAPRWVPAGDPIPGTGTPAKPLIVFPHVPAFRPWPFGDAPLITPIHPGAPATPAPRPVRNPYPRVRPLTPEMPDYGPRPGQMPRPGGAPAPAPRPSPGPGGAPELVINPSGRVQPRPNPHRWQRPARGTKENKARFGPVLSFIWRSMGQITEGIDLIDALYEALPKRRKVQAYKLKGRQPNPIEKMGLLYDYIDELNVGKAIKNVIKQEIEDRILGEFGKRIGKFSRQSGRPIGFQAGPAL